jgi:hypothetical protein
MSVKPDARRIRLLAIPPAHSAMRGPNATDVTPTIYREK